jgi:hypothetical protein
MITRAPVLAWVPFSLLQHEKDEGTTVLSRRSCCVWSKLTRQVRAGCMLRYLCVGNDLLWLEKLEGLVKAWTRSRSRTVKSGRVFQFRDLNASFSPTPSLYSSRPSMIAPTNISAFTSTLNIGADVNRQPTQHDPTLPLVLPSFLLFFHTDDPSGQGAFTPSSWI